MTNGKQRFKLWCGLTSLGHAYCHSHEVEAIAWRRAALLGIAIADPGLSVRAVLCGHNTRTTTPLATSRRPVGPNGSRRRQGSTKQRRGMSSRQKPS
jgi:hypothetical protein